MGSRRAENIGVQWSKSCSRLIRSGLSMRSSASKYRMDTPSTNIRDREVVLRSGVSGNKQNLVLGDGNMPVASIDILSDIQSYMLQSRNKASDPWLHQLLEMMYNFIELEKKSYLAPTEDDSGYKITRNAGHTVNLLRDQPRINTAPTKLPLPTVGEAPPAVKRPPNTAFVVNVGSNSDVRKRLKTVTTQTELLRDYALKSIVATKTTQTFIQTYKNIGVQAEVVPLPTLPFKDRLGQIIDRNNNSCCCNSMNMNCDHRRVGIPGDHDGDWQQYRMLQQRQMSSRNGNDVCWVLENHQKVYGAKFKNVAAPKPPISGFSHNENEILKEAQFTMQSSRYNEFAIKSEESMNDNHRGFESSKQIMSQEHGQICRSSGRFLDDNGGQMIQRNTDPALNTNYGLFIGQENGQITHARSGQFLDQNMYEPGVHANSGQIMDGNCSGQNENNQELTSDNGLQGNQEQEPAKSPDKLPLPAPEEVKKGVGSRFKAMFRRQKSSSNT